MSGRYLLVLALSGLILTQAIFAKEVDNTDKDVKDPSHTMEDDDLSAGASFLQTASQKVGALVDEVGNLLLGEVAPSMTADGKVDNGDDLALANELAKSMPPHSSANEGFADAYPPPEEREPIITKWVRPKTPKKTPKKTAEKTPEKIPEKTSEKTPEKTPEKIPELAEEDPELTEEVPELTEAAPERKKGRKVKSYTVSGNDVQFNSPEGSEESGEEHKRVKRSHLGDGIPDEFEFTLEALSPYDTDPAEFHIGSVIPYRLTIHASHIETDVKLEIFSELSGGAFFMVSNIRTGSVGGNFDSALIESALVVEYYSKFNDGRWDYATVDMGYLLNDATDTGTASESQIEVLFEIQALVHGALVEDEIYRVSVGAMYQSETFVTVAQDDLTYKDHTVLTPLEATFTIQGVDTLQLGETGVWTIEAVVYDLYSELSLDVLAPLHTTGVMTIDKISVESVGEHFSYSAVANNDGGNFTRTTFENYGDYGRLNLGEIINAGYHDAENTEAKSTITFEVAITMLDHEYNETNPYTVGFTVWKKDADSVEIMWSAQQSVQAANDTLPDLTSSPEFEWNPSAESVFATGRFAVLVNMSIPSGSTAKYILEASVPVNDSEAMMEIEAVRISRIGFNMPHMHIREWTESPSSTEQTDNIHIDFISWDLGIITNTGQREHADDQVIQFEIMIRILPEADTHYDNGDAMQISLGMKHAEDYYWVGRTSIIYSDTPIEYNAEKVPEFSFVNVMGSDAMIYAHSAAVYDLDMIIPAGVDYDGLSMEISTKEFVLNATHLRIFSMEIVHIGKALYCENIHPVNLTYLTLETDLDDRPMYTTGILTIDRVTSLRDENFKRYSFEDSTIRIRTIVVARGNDEGVPSLMTDGAIYWTETTVSFADNYIYAARAGIQYNTTIPNMYADTTGEVATWKSSETFEIWEGNRNVVAKGELVHYNITIALPYRTVADIFVKFAQNAPEVQVCRLKTWHTGDAIVNYESPFYEGDVMNSTEDTYINIAYSSRVTMTSFSYDYYVGDITDSHVQYEAIVMLNDRAQIGTNYSFDGVVKVGLNDAITYTPTLATVEKEADVATLPEVYIGKLHGNGTDVINFGGSELYYVDVYVPPGTQHHMVVNIFAPWNSSFYSDYEILEAYVLSAGENLICFDNYHTQITLNKSSDNMSPNYNLAIVNLGYVPNVAAVDTDTEVEENKIRVIAHVAVNQHSTLSPDAVIPVASTLDIDGDHLWVGYIESTVVEASDETNENYVNNSITLTIEALGSTTYIIGETQHYEARLYIPPGTAVAAFSFEVNSPEDRIRSVESRLHIFNVNFIDCGFNLIELRDHNISATENDYGVEHFQKVDFDFIRNSDISGLSSFIEKINTSNPISDNEIRFNFSVRVLDTVALADGFEFNMSSFITPGSHGMIEATGDITITITSPDSDNADFSWLVDFVDLPLEIFQDTNLTFNVELLLTDDARRFPNNLSINVRVPWFSSLVDVFNVSTLLDDFTEPSEVDQYGLKFQWFKIRWYNPSDLKFEITVDPDYTLEPGLGDRYVSIPVDLSWQIEIRDGIGGSFDDWFSEMRILTFTLKIPENYDALGMDSGEIESCQITASSYNGTDEPANARPSLDGWSTGHERGPPLYQNEYIQVDMGGKVKFTGITIFPFNDASFSRITEFKIQYSRKGIRWDYALDNNLEPKTFTITWPSFVNASTSEFIALDRSAFIAQYIRILPQANAENSYTSKLRFELNGYSWPFGSTLPSYSCPPGADPSLRGYVERQILAVPSPSLELYACTIPEPGQLPYCSATDDFGVSWFAMDDNVLNVYGYDSLTSTAYGLARDRKTCLRSKDGGHSWKAIACSVVTGMSNNNDYTEAKEVPFVIEGDNSADLFDNYGTEVDATHSWSVSAKALHGYPTDTAGVASKNDDENQVAYWGNKAWTNP